MLFRLRWLDIRSNLSVIGFLTTIMYLYVIKEEMPPISFLTWTHYFTFLSLSFVSLVVFAVTCFHVFDPFGENDIQQAAKWKEGHLTGPTVALMTEREVREKEAEGGASKSHSSHTSEASGGGGDLLKLTHTATERQLSKVFRHLGEWGE